MIPSRNFISFNGKSGWRIKNRTKSWQEIIKEFFLVINQDVNDSILDINEFLNDSDMDYDLSNEDEDLIILLKVKVIFIKLYNFKKFINS